jgi:hypothetical protein
MKNYNLDYFKMPQKIYTVANQKNFTVPSLDENGVLYVSYLSRRAVARFSTCLCLAEMEKLVVHFLAQIFGPFHCTSEWLYGTLH